MSGATGVPFTVLATGLQSRTRLLLTSCDPQKGLLLQLWGHLLPSDCKRSVFMVNNDNNMPAHDMWHTHFLTAVELGTLSGQPVCQHILLF